MTAIVTLGAMARIGDVSIVTAVLVGLPATVMFDWAYWWAGRRWGEHSIHMIMGTPTKRTAARMAKVKRWSEKYGAWAVLTAYYLPVPTVLIYAAAGWAGMSLATFLILDIVGALLWVGLLAGLGYWIGQSAIDAVDKVGDYTLYFTIALVVVVVGRSILTTRRQLQEIDREAAAAAPEAAVTE
jgi:membrane protein DedA with SNARE-associated domain